MDPNQPQDPAQNQPAPADGGQPTSPVADPNNQPAPEPTGDESGNQPAAEPQGDDPGADGQPSDPNGQQPAGSRQERRNQERESRIRELNRQVKQSGQPNQPAPGMQQSPQMPVYEDGQTVSAQQLQQDVVQTASAIANLQVQHQLQQRDAVNNFERDTETVPTKFAELNPDNASYTPELDEAIAQEYQDRAFRIVGYDPNTGQPIRQLDGSVRLSDIAERHVKAARAYAAKVNSQQQTAVNSAADAAAPRPNGAKPADVPFESLSLDEMRKQVGYHKV